MRTPVDKPSWETWRGAFAAGRLHFGMLASAWNQASGQFRGLRRNNFFINKYDPTDTL